MSKIRWRILNSDRVEVSPESREHAWKDLMIDLLQTSPNYVSYRTAINRADFENFDYNRPIVYEINERNLLINSEFFNVALNRPSCVVAPLNITPLCIFLAFICSLLIALISAVAAHTYEHDGTKGYNVGGVR
ncbi:unknown [Spodoptera litura nucleopolyhedrovirus]|uniref:Pif-6 n=1 Tax=Spodoptera litura multicapsid nucleopolyhedrovirus TaxID=46242 RepID=Q91BF9_NPVST|nr:hypothetical protein [Spodoptera litura nucleopolyhedrovirus]AAL01748.1 unknown [Spodoptera litura nucleopolyhedrovirus]